MADVMIGALSCVQRGSERLRERGMCVEDTAVTFRDLSRR